MNKLILLLIFNLFSFQIFAQSISDLDDKNGYKDLTFSLSLETIIKKTNAKLQGWLSTKELDAYTIRNKEYEKFGNFSGTILLFKAKKDTLIHTIYFNDNKKGIAEFKELIMFFQSLYGMETDKDTYNYIWKGVKVELILSYDYIQEKTSFDIINLEAENRYEEEKEKIRNETKKEF
jgi:hypothetical protein